ncbi:uncharacterized protein GLRG_07803 [Colletotrichum graminicola M1.001]|uniref:Fasciclin domain family protein n=1 Tax=Colletotrichum graminicola (strain M1.001 / M2 / FGSC 10212) TaxID=645133 RepID=E3QP71_COLGM|nr:uncharacterized protein GLRG_07803 [Colletotrichum graminicola M1.001]EFQ32659.1 hypothetical protein GLRG_07803 [Colletotrichum graminicola M1.001]
MANAAAGEVFCGSQASSHFALEPISAAVLCSRETKRRDAAKERGPLRVGCREMDEEVLVGGFERGTVVGISSESDQMGLLISLQSLASTLCEEGGGDTSKEKDARAMVVTTQPPATVLPTLRDAIRAELRARGTAEAEVKSKLRSCLERVSVSRVFDLEGLWEVLGDFYIPTGSVTSQTSPVPHEQQQQPDQEQRGERGGGKEDMGEVVRVPEPLPDLPRHSAPEEQPEGIVLPELKPAKPTRTEIADSDEEDALSLSSELSSPPSSIRSPTPYAADSPEKPASQDSHHEDTQEEIQDETREEIHQVPQEQAENKTPEEQPNEPGPPDIILITHFQSLMTALFTRHNRQSAHHSLQVLSTHLRYLARNLPSSPLIMLLNGTSSSKEAPTSASRPADHQDGPPPPLNYGGGAGGSRSNKPLDPTLRSIFNPPPLNSTGYGGNQAASRRNRPTFGLVFSQLLDLHLLCTRVPRNKEDVEKIYALAPGPGVGGENGGFKGGARYVWVIEVLLDELGVWEGDILNSTVKVRKGREQRWAAVDVKGGRVVDAFEVAEQNARGSEVRGGGLSHNTECD